MYDTMSSCNTETAVIQTKHSLRKTLSMGSTESSSATRKKGMRGMLKRGFSFSLKKSISKRSLMKRRESGGADSLSSLSSTESLERTVRFATEGRSKKVKAQVIEFQKHSAEDIPNIWYTEADMLDIVEDVKQTVKHYHRNCERYRYAMDKISQRCATAPDTITGDDSVTDQFDPRVLEQLSNAAARGLEHHIAPRMDDTRKDIVREVIETQASLFYCKSKQEKETMLAQKYSRLSRTAKLLAKTMGDGDAMVATTVVANDAVATTVVANDAVATTVAAVSA